MKKIFLLSIVGNHNRKREELNLTVSSGNVQSVNFGNLLRGIRFQQWLFLRVLIIWFRKLKEKILLS